MNLIKRQQYTAKKQTGAVLITVLILLLVLTISISANVNNILIEEKVVTNQRDRLIAMESAESALREAETWVGTQITEPIGTVDGSGNIWSTDAAKETSESNEWWLDKDADWWENNASKADFSGATKEPYYVIEDYAYVQDSLVMGQQKDNRGRNFYRITAKGTGGTNTARVVLQTTFTKRF